MKSIACSCPQWRKQFSISHDKRWSSSLILSKRSLCLFSSISPNIINQNTNNQMHQLLFYMQATSDRILKQICGVCNCLITNYGWFFSGLKNWETFFSFSSFLRQNDEKLKNSKTYLSFSVFRNKDCSEKHCRYLRYLIQLNILFLYVFNQERVNFI